MLWLRVIASFLVVFYHGIRFYDVYPSDISLTNDRIGTFFESFSRFLTQWHMPLFFVLSGFSLKLSLSKVHLAIDQSVIDLTVPLPGAWVMGNDARACAEASRSVHQ